jgi:hypothetical protein
VYVDAKTVLEAPIFEAVTVDAYNVPDDTEEVAKLLAVTVVINLIIYNIIRN